MMVVKDELCFWFKNLCAKKRIEYMCTMIHMCTPLELRFVGTVLEDYAKKDFHALRKAEVAANEVTDVEKLRSLVSPVELRAGLFVTLALMRSSNTACGQQIYDIIQNNLDRAFSFGLGDDDEIFAEDVLTLLSLAAHHPALKFEQRRRLYEHLLLLENSDLGLSVLKREEEIEKAAPLNLPSRGPAMGHCDGQVPTLVRPTAHYGISPHVVHPEMWKVDVGGPLHFPPFQSPYGLPDFLRNYYSVPSWAGHSMTPAQPLQPPFVPSPSVTDSFTSPGSSGSGSASPAAQGTPVIQLLKLLNLEVYNTNLQDVSFEQLCGMSREELSERGLPQDAQLTLLSKLDQINSEKTGVAGGVVDSSSAQWLPASCSSSSQGSVSGIPMISSTSRQGMSAVPAGESEDCSDTGKTYSHQHVKRAEVSAARGAGDASSSSHLPPANARPVPAASTDRQTAHLQQQVVPSLVPPLPLQPNPLSIPPPPGFVRQTLHVHSEADSGLKGGREGSSSNTSNVETETCPVRPTGISCQSSLLQNSVGSQRTAGQSQETHPNKLPVGFSVPGIEVSSASKPTGRGGNHSPHVQDSSRPSTHVQVSLGAWPAIHPHPSASRSSDTSQCGTEVVTTMSAAKADTMATGNPPSVLAAASSHQSPSHSSKHNHVQGNSSSTSESDNIAAHSSVDLSLQTAGLSGQAESNPEGRHQPSVYAHLSQSLYGSVPIVAHPGPNGFAIPPPFYPFHMGSHHPGIHPYILPVFPSLISTPGQVPPATHVQYEGFSSQVSGGGGGGMAVHPGIAQPQAAKEKAAGHRSNGLSMQEHSTGCYNCGAKDHSAASCPQSSMETMSGKSSYALDFTPQDTAE